MFKVDSFAYLETKEGKNLALSEDGDLFPTNVEKSIE